MLDNFEEGKRGSIQRLNPHSQSRGSKKGITSSAVHIKEETTDFTNYMSHHKPPISTSGKKMHHKPFISARSRSQKSLVPEGKTVQDMINEAAEPDPSPSPLKER